MARALPELIALSADPRAQHPTTIRAVIREAGIVNTNDGDDLTVFLDCVTVRDLLAAGELPRADLCARQIGAALTDFMP